MFKFLAAVIVAVALSGSVIILVPGLQASVSEKIGIGEVITSRFAPITEAKKALAVLKQSGRLGQCPEGFAELNEALADLGEGPACVDSVDGETP